MSDHDWEASLARYVEHGKFWNGTRYTWEAKTAWEQAVLALLRVLLAP